jgi:hypothetical protein
MSDNLLGSFGHNGIQFVEPCLFDPSRSHPSPDNPFQGQGSLRQPVLAE